MEILQDNMVSFECYFTLGKFNYSFLLLKNESLDNDLNLKNLYLDADMSDHLF